MAWIESHQGLAQHPKTRRLARLLNEPIPSVIGRLHMLWWWAMEYAQDGDLSRYEPEDIADAVMWDSDARELMDALVKSGFIDVDGDDIRIHDWDEYAGRLIEQRKLLAERKKRSRELYDNQNLTRAVRSRDGDKCRYCGKTVNWKDRKSPDGGTYDHVDPDGPNSIDNIVVACRGCNSTKGRRTPEEAGMVLLPTNKYQTDLSTGNLHEIKPKSAIPNLTIPKEREIDHALVRIVKAYEETIGPLQGEPNQLMMLRDYCDKGMDVELVVTAIHKSSHADHPLRYADRILRNQLRKGILTVQQAMEAEAKRDRPVHIETRVTSHSRAAPAQPTPGPYVSREEPPELRELEEEERYATRFNTS